MTDDEGPRRLKLLGGARLAEDGRIAISAMVFRGPLHVATEEVFLSVDDAAVLQAQLSRALDGHASRAAERAAPPDDRHEREHARTRSGF